LARATTVTVSRTLHDSRFGPRIAKESDGERTPSIQTQEIDARHAVGQAVCCGVTRGRIPGEQECAGAQKVEHYEIASYGTLAYFADLLGESEAKRLLGQTLEEEKAADEKLNGIARTSIPALR
jgi:ferritin-like metal-binding protein YciE